MLDEDSQQNLDVYQKSKTKLNSYFMQERNKHYARYMFLKTRPEAGEATVAYMQHDCERKHMIAILETTQIKEYWNILFKLSKMNFLYRDAYLKAGHYNYS